MLDRDNPADMWQVMEAGNHRAPDWSRVAVEVDWDADPDSAIDPGNSMDPGNVTDPGNSNKTKKTSGSGGGCFIGVAASNG